MKIKCYSLHYASRLTLLISNKNYSCLYHSVLSDVMMEIRATFEGFPVVFVNMPPYHGSIPYC